VLKQIVLLAPIVLKQIVLLAPTKHALEQVWARWRASPDAGVKKMVSYFDSRAPPHNNKIHLFPAKSVPHFSAFGVGHASITQF
jgi:hypothetical protein